MKTVTELSYTDNFVKTVIRKFAEEKGIPIQALTDDKLWDNRFTLGEIFFEEVNAYMDIEDTIEEMQEEEE